MAKTYLEHMIDTMGIPADKVSDDLKEYLMENIRRAGLNPDDEVDAAVMGFEPFTCSICGKEITDEHSNNAEPVNSGRCCNKCNREVVIPARIKGLK